MTKNSNRSTESAENGAPKIQFRSPVITTCLVVIALCIGGYAFSYLKAVLSPLLIALFIFFLTNPLVRMLQARNISPIYSYFIVLMSTIITFTALGWVFFGNIQDINERIPAYQTNLGRVVDRISGPVMRTMEFLGVAPDAETEGESPNRDEEKSESTLKTNKTSYVASQEAGPTSESAPSPLPETAAPQETPIEDRIADAIGKAAEKISEDKKQPAVTPAPKTEREKMVRMLGDLIKSGSAELLNQVVGTSLEYLEITLMTIFYLFFILVESHKLPGRIKRGFNYESTQTLMEMGQSIQRSIEQYLRVKTGVSFGLGVTTGLISMMFGLDFWLLWAGFMFLSNYVTYIGSMVALVPPIAIAFLQFDSLLGAAVLSGLLIANRFFWIDYAEIKLSGQHLNVSPVILLLSIALFGSLWGVIGMVLAVPVVTSVKIALSQFDSTSHLASLLSED